jgi:hypothetical protein
MMMVVMTVMVVMGMHDDHDLCLRRVGNREAADKNQAKQDFLHA